MRTRFAPSIGREVDHVAPRTVTMRTSRHGSDIYPHDLGRGLLTAAGLMVGGGAGEPTLGGAPAGELEGEPLEVSQPMPAPVGEYWSTVTDPFAVQSTLPEVEDGRLFHPDATSPLRRVSSRAVRRMQSSGSVLATYVPDAIEVPAEASVIMCIRRKSRRGVILALGHGGGFHRPPRRGPKSDIWC